MPPEWRTVGGFLMKEHSMKSRDLGRAFLQFMLGLALVLAASGCTIKLIADYDEATDKSVTDLQRKLSTFFVDLDGKLGTPEEGYDNYEDTYKEIRVDISALSLRVNALPKNAITQEQVEILKRNLSLLEQLHKSGLGTGIDGKKAVLASTQKDFDTALAAILKLELAKKRGEQSKE
jgi:hypothetical protein